MKICCIGNTQLRLHPGMLLILALAYVFGRMEELLLSTLALIVHESSHALAAGAMGYPIISVELLPFGGVARLRDAMLSPHSEWLIAMAGPLSSFITAAAVGTVLYWTDIQYSQLEYFFQVNLFLGGFNLLPALPLDGGRMLRGLLLMFLRPRFATMLTAWLGIALGGALLGLGLYGGIRGGGFVAALLGAFLLLAAVKELRCIPQARLEALLRRQDTIAKKNDLPLRHSAVHANTTVMEAVRSLGTNRYNLLLVVEDDLTALGELDEGTLLQGAARYGGGITIRELLEHRNRERGLRTRR